MARKQNTEKRKPIFLRQQSKRKKLEKNWRAPRGGESKLRKRKKGRFIPSIGYSSAKKVKQFVINNIKELDLAKEAGIKTVVASSVLGIKKKIELGERAKNFGITFLNIDIEKLNKKIQEKRLRTERKKAKEKKKVEEKKDLAVSKEKEPKVQEVAESQEELEKKKILEKRI